MSIERVIFGFVLLAGCGSIVDGEYRGEVLFTIEGRVYEQGLSVADRRVSVALLWALAVDPGDRTQTVSVRTEFPARYFIDLHTPPPVSAVLPLAGVPGVEVAIGHIVLYDDIDGDGIWDEDEVILGGAFDNALLWVAPDGAPGPEAEEVAVDLLAGYQLVVRSATFACDDPAPEVLVPVGASTDLVVGYYWPLVADLACNDAAEDEPVELLEEECPDETVLDEECARLEEQNTEDAWLLTDTFWVDCLDEVCPDVVDERFGR